MAPGLTLSNLGDAATNAFGNVLTNSLSQVDQNGGGYWGMPDAPHLPGYRSDGGTPLPNGCPWGTITAGNSNPYTSQPNTGITRYYDFQVSLCDIAPDGVSVPHAICVNGQFPGPLIEANYGDWIQVHVTNNLPDEGTSMHWHGMLQTDTPWEDGVPGVGECPIAPGRDFTYQFRANLYGTSWYHSHYSAQYSAAAEGPMVIYGPNNVDYDYDLGPVMLSDWCTCPY